MTLLNNLRELGRANARVNVAIGDAWRIRELNEFRAGLQGNGYIGFLWVYVPSIDKHVSHEVHLDPTLQDGAVIVTDDGREIAVEI